jgi:shikimate kinase
LIFLIGYRGTGKSTLARLLADRLGWTCVDADERLEAGAGRSIRQIFAEEGEAGFRAREAGLFTELCSYREHVIATGGGVVLSPFNRERLQARGWVVWLTADARTIHERLQADQASAERRPPLTVGGLAEIEQLLQAREALYQECADLIVATDGRSPEVIAQEILSAWLAQE